MRFNSRKISSISSTEAPATIRIKGFRFSGDETAGASPSLRSRRRPGASRRIEWISVMPYPLHVLAIGTIAESPVWPTHAPPEWIIPPGAAADKNRVSTRPIPPAAAIERSALRGIDRVDNHFWRQVDPTPVRMEERGCKGAARGRDSGTYLPAQYAGFCLKNFFGTVP